MDWVENLFLWLFQDHKHLIMGKMAARAERSTHYWQGSKALPWVLATEHDTAVNIILWSIHCKNLTSNIDLTFEHWKPQFCQPWETFSNSNNKKRNCLPKWDFMLHFFLYSIFNLLFHRLHFPSLIQDFRIDYNKLSYVLNGDANIQSWFLTMNLTLLY